MSENYFALKSGSLLKDGRFRIESYLGSGGFGITYKAFDTQFKTYVAIKEFMPANIAVRTGDTMSSDSASHTGMIIAKGKEHLSEFEHGLKRFFKEAQSLAAFRGFNGILQVIDYFEENNTAYMITEYIDGHDLQYYIENSDRSILPSEKVHKIHDTIIGALSVIHKASIYHRDIKPKNIMIRENGEAVLIDFGAARQKTANDTQSTQGLHTPPYSPMEQYITDSNDETTQIGAWTDLYSFSVTLYYMITGKKVPEAPSRYSRTVDKYKPLSQMDINTQHYDKGFLQAIDKNLSVDSVDRFQSTEEYLSAINKENKDNVEIVVPRKPASDDVTASTSVDQPNEKSKKENKYIFIWLIIFVLISFFLIAFNFEREEATSAPSDTGSNLEDYPLSNDSQKEDFVICNWTIEDDIPIQKRSLAFLRKNIGNDDFDIITEMKNGAIIHKVNNNRHKYFDNKTKSYQEYYKIEYNGQSGFVRADFVRKGCHKNKNFYHRSSTNNLNRYNYKQKIICNMGKALDNGKMFTNIRSAPSASLSIITDRLINGTKVEHIKSVPSPVNSDFIYAYVRYKDTHSGEELMGYVYEQAVMSESSCYKRHEQKENPPQTYSIDELNKAFSTGGEEIKKHAAWICNYNSNQTNIRDEANLSKDSIIYQAKNYQPIFLVKAIPFGKKGIDFYWGMMSINDKAELVYVAQNKVVSTRWCEK